MYFAGKLVYLIVLASNQLAIKPFPANNSNSALEQSFCGASEAKRHRGKTLSIRLPVSLSNCHALLVLAPLLFGGALHALVIYLLILFILI